MDGRSRRNQREMQKVAGGHKGKLTWMWEDTTTNATHIRTHPQTKRRTPPKAETHADAHTSVFSLFGGHPAKVGAAAKMRLHCGTHRTH